MIGFCYRNIMKPIFFLQDPEKVHIRTTHVGERLGESAPVKKIFSLAFRHKYPALSQSLFGIGFETPVGLAAGFDYEAKLTQILPSLGFGFGTVGTLTNFPYEGNPRPMLGRLPHSRSLMVNKGFKNLGVKNTLNNLRDKTFEYPVGVSIGKTNTAAHKTQEEAVHDIIAAFRIAEKSSVPFAYYELNISCPNLAGSIEFYAPHHLRNLLAAVETLHVKKPLFIKMPISKTDAEISEMLEVITSFSFVQAVILGNLQRDRHNPNLIPEEVARFTAGNFSGLPCQSRSDELIRLVFRDFGKKIKIIGCGGIFSAKDAYRKMKLGASLVELITGLVYEGPQLVAQINSELPEFLARDGLHSIREAVGLDA